MNDKVTMKSIAKELGISINAVSLALNNRVGVSDETRIKVLQAANRLGYISNNSRFSQTFRRFNFCIMIQDIYSRDMDFYGKLLFFAVQEFKKNGYDTILNYFSDTHMAIPDCVENRRVSGILIIGKISDENVKMLQAFTMPLVIIDHEPLSSSANCVMSDSKSGGVLATNYLINCGYEEIGFFGDLEYSLPIRDRYFGFLWALKKKGITENGNQDNYVKKYSITGSVEQHVLNNDIDAIARIVSAHETLPKSYLCSNDNATFALIAALRENGIRVPDDISVVGFDNIELCEKTVPKLTTINVNKEVMGQKAVQRLLHLLEHKNEINEKIVLGVELVERASVLPFRAPKIQVKKH